MSTNRDPLPLTYPDLVCVLDLDPLASETTSDLQSLEQDGLHILIEDPGSNLDDLGRGVGIESLLSGSTLSLNDAAAHIDAQLVKDDRIDASSTKIVQQSDGTYSLEIDLSVSGTVLPLSFGYSAFGGLNVL